MTDAITVNTVFQKVASEQGHRPAMRVKVDGTWQTTSWKEYYDQACLAARGFMKLGLEPGQGVAIIGYNCPQWFIADVGAIMAGGVPAGIYTTNAPDQCQYIAEHADCSIAVAENAEQLAKFKAIRDQLPLVKALVLMNGDDPDEDVYSWDALLVAGADVAEADLEARIAAQKPDDTCTLIYTSGTTGQPKAVMITHDNITWTAKATMETMDAATGDELISYLPLSHIAEQMVSVHGPMQFAGCVSFAEGIEQLGDNLREVRPHIFLGVPRVWEKIQGKVESAGANNSGLKKKIAKWARGVGLASGYADQKGAGRPFFHGLADKIVFSKVKERLGLDRCKLQVTAAAPIGKSTLEFFLSLGVPIYEVYGMSECTGPATISLPGRYMTGKAGFCLPGAELKIAEDGEICMRGRHVFKGYYKNEAATEETIDSEGWLHSGDIGEVDDKGFLQITDRKKDILITAGGENIAPQVIEGALKSISIIGQAVVIGDRRKFLSALITLDPEKLKAEAAAAGSSETTPEGIASCDKMRAHIQAQLDTVNGTLARVQTIKKFTIIPGEFSIEGGELTPTMKIKRKVVREKYTDDIEAFYA